VPAVVELRGPRAGMIGHGGGLLQRAAVLEICCDARGPETMIADLGLYASRCGASTDHRMGVGLGQGSAGELARAAADGPKQWPFCIGRDAGAVEILVKRLLQVVMAGHGVIFAALFMKPHPQPAILRENVLDLHP